MDNSASQAFSQPMSAPDWMSLPDIDAVPKVSARDYEVFNELKDVLKKHNMLERFGVTLLHKHFDINPDEMLMETIDTETRTLTIRPVVAATLPSHIQTSWRFFDREGAAAIQSCVGCVTVCLYVGEQHAGANHQHGQA